MLNFGQFIPNYLVSLLSHVVFNVLMNFYRQARLNLFKYLADLILWSFPTKTKPPLPLSFSLTSKPLKHCHKLWIGDFYRPPRLKNISKGKKHSQRHNER